jgi:Uma2 family endonuclease
MATQALPFCTPEEYLEREYAADTRHEYYAGQVFAMAGGSPEHSFIGANLIAALGVRLREQGCRTANSDLRVQAGTLYTYPDVTVVCGEPRYTGHRADTLTNPTLLIEVLSETTEAYDRGAKFALYQQIESLHEYVLVAQDKPCLERYLRQTDGTWLYVKVEGTDTELPLGSVRLALPLSAVYEGIAFPTVPPLPPRPAPDSD